MKCYAVVENVQEGLEKGVGHAGILGLFLINQEDNGKVAKEKAEKCLRDRYMKAVGEQCEGATEFENEPEPDEDGNLCAEWVCSSNDSFHSLDVREVEITE